LREGGRVLRWRIAQRRAGGMTQGEDRAVPAAEIAWLRREGLAGLVLRDAALTLCTAGLYRFWGRAAWRRHVWSRVALRGDPLEFAGTGLDGFKGFLLGLALFAPLLGAIDLAGRFAATRGLVPLVLAKLAYAAALLTMLGAMRFLRLRYLIAGTRWRGVSPALDARLLDYARVVAPLQALNALALFALSPWVWQRRHAWLIGRLRLGEARGAGTPDWRPLVLPWAGVWVSGAVALACLASWTLAAAQRSGRAPAGLPVPPVVAPGWVAALALAAALACLAAYRMAAWRTLAVALRLGPARLSSHARPGFAAGRALLAVLVFAAVLAAGLACAGALLMPVPRGVPQILGAAWAVLGAIVAVAALALARDAFFRPSAIAHFVATLELHDGGALDDIVAPPASPGAGGWGRIDVAAG
jgi:uncharacterized membrane protein YjgN (DUF898 family)